MEPSKVQIVKQLEQQIDNPQVQSIDAQVAARERPNAHHPVAIKRRPSAFGALLSRSLPDYQGKYAVGIRDVELDVPHQSFGHFLHKNMPNQQAGIALESVLFTLFYPTQSKPLSTRKRSVWFPKLGQTIDGFLRMARRTPNWFYRSIAYPLAAAAIWGTTFPAEANSKLLPPDIERGKWPVILFSHGVGCSRLMYSHFAGEMASRGFVVVAIEHRDGSGPASTIELEDGTRRDLSWLDWRDLDWPDLTEQPKDDNTLRKAQLEMRLAEMDETIRALKIMAGMQEVDKLSRRQTSLDVLQWSSIDMDRLICAGHSFGATLALAAGLQSKHRFHGIIAFDPAVERMEPWSGQIHDPVLVINSAEFVKSSDFGRLNRLRRSASSSSVFSIGKLPKLVIAVTDCWINRKTGLKVDAPTIFDLSIPAVLAFLEGDLVGLRKMEAQNKFIWHEVQNDEVSPTESMIALDKIISA